jgi:hypothetical protein
MDVEKLIELGDKAAPGPWGWGMLDENGEVTGVCRVVSGVPDVENIMFETRKEDARFICAARAHFPELLRRWKRVSELVGFYVRQYPEWQCHSIEIPHRHRAELRELLDLPAEGK